MPRDAAAFEADVVVVDEVSMVDLELMARLFAACESVPRLVLLGDPRQLASVEAGAVLADLCGDAEESAPVAGLERSIARLTKSHRYRAAGGIGLLAEAVRAGDADRALEILADPRHADVERHEIESVGLLAGRLAAEVRQQQAAVARRAVVRGEARTPLGLPCPLRTPPRPLRRRGPRTRARRGGGPRAPNFEPRGRVARAACSS